MAVSDTIWLALIAVASPLLTAWLMNRHVTQQKKVDYARQDEVANRLLARQEDTARLLKENNSAVAVATTETHAQLKVIHTLVNSNMTAAMQAEHDATARELAMMREVVDLKQRAGHEPSDEALAAIRVTEAKIGELKATLADRLAQTKVAAEIA